MDKNKAVPKTHVQQLLTFEKTAFLGLGYTQFYKFIPDHVLVEKSTQYPLKPKNIVFLFHPTVHRVSRPVVVVWELYVVRWFD